MASTSRPIAHGACAVPQSELVQLKLNIETSVGESTPTEAGYGVPLPLVEVGVSHVDEVEVWAGAMRDVGDGAGENQGKASGQNAELGVERLKEISTRG